MILYVCKKERFVMKKEEYVKTIVVNGHMVNVGLDDCGQTYFLEYVNDKGELVEDCVGAYETNYESYAEGIFEIPEHCEHFKTCGDMCEHGDKSYCYRCKYSPLVIERNKRWLEKYGVPYPEEL